MTPDIAARFARIALGHLTREYPHKLDHVLTGDADAETPRALHPIFFGSFDWHSCVHGYWMILTLLHRFPDMAGGEAVAALADTMLTPDKVAAEVAYVARPSSAGFERPYGWAWALALHGAAARHEGRGWGAALEPLARAFADRFTAFLPKQTYPIRTGTHFNTAFALILALDWAETHDAALAALIRSRATDYYATDRDCPAWEPGGDEFLSGALCEALLMRRVLGAAEGRAWFAAFLPRLGEGQPATLLTPAFVSDRTDGKIAHLDGLNLSRAWCWRGLADWLPEGMAGEVAERHLAAALPHVAGDYMGEHWLATFATLALSSY
ncbi:DUF2891 domain-containing protein [Sphingomonas naphthae]|uniref:DUF2891 domain-containing protein n=1 Tax=Sphingomonas naphthae TaxID=1813468 RepID=A0ABY7TPQ0_9SPHN|nr:DUF2891 domain-containing protein [Sphingomonas naphthae]WCT74961.1 DUF2891 domain-containing protein [Sphingomonas naphthae]